MDQKALLQNADAWEHVCKLRQAACTEQPQRWSQFCAPKRGVLPNFVLGQEVYMQDTHDIVALINKCDQ